MAARKAHLSSVATQPSSVYTWRGDDNDPLRWIISLRKANKGETNAYRTTFPQ
jgi:uncharacterized DUF497 family protein